MWLQPCLSKEMLWLPFIWRAFCENRSVSKHYTISLRVLLYSCTRLRVCLLNTLTKTAIIDMLSPVLPIFFWYTSWTFDWCSVVFWNPFVVLFFLFSFSSTSLLILAHLVELFSFATALSWHFYVSSIMAFSSSVQYKDSLLKMHSCTLKVCVVDS